VRRLLVVSILALAAPAAIAQEPLTKPEIVDQSGAICRDLNEDALPHARRFSGAETRRGAIRHGRRFIRTSRPYVRDLADLKPDAGRRYDRFVDKTWTALDWLDEALDALAARRGRLAGRRAEKVGDAAARARRAAKRYGLRRSCIRFVS
jgi:hypothetical protein